ncbi:putative plant disease resistance response protein [Medicago truncatula]|uniref:Dirigent protein n=2 Tax=Medicago truncatula TaxID=3880 RepID=A0A396I827_MEDTR|nr:dirigent protein 9 [Medicago truncatula]RHN60883.1 putative plant disease resistance response protein [Medicago truncatula]
MLLVHPYKYHTNNESHLIKTKNQMAIKFSFTSFSFKIIVIHLSLFSITLKYAKTEEYPPPLTFYMHDILGGSNPSERIMNGIIVNTQQTTNIPFSKPNNKILPNKGSIPIFDTSISTNGSPSTKTIIKNIDKNKVVIDTNSNSLPYVTSNQLPLGVTIQKLLFGRITVIDDEITKGYELNSDVIGKVQGFHLVSSLDGSSQTMAFTALFGDESHDDDDDAINFFGVHRMATHESYIAVVGGTGKYENARGYAKIETLQLPYQHRSTNNGMETLFQITVYL